MDSAQQRIDALEKVIREVMSRSSMMLHQNVGRWDSTKEHVKRAINVTQSNIDMMRKILDEEYFEETDLESGDIVEIRFLGDEGCDNQYSGSAEYLGMCKGNHFDTPHIHCKIEGKYGPVYTNFPLDSLV